MIVMASFAPVGVMLWDYLVVRHGFRVPLPPPAEWWTIFLLLRQQMKEGVNIWARFVGTAVACLMLLGVAVRASTSITTERERQTLDGLLTSPLGSSAILFGKWIGSILSVRWLWLWLVPVWAVAWVFGGLHPLAPFLVALDWLIMAGFLGTVGLWFSTVCRSSQRATLATMLTTLFLGGGHWLLWLCCVPFFMMHDGPETTLEQLFMFQFFGLTTPVTLGLLAFRGDEFESWHLNRDLEGGRLALLLLAGLAVWLLGTGIVWVMTLTRFRELANRNPRGLRRGQPRQSRG
jgi:hypothetical protein